MFGKIHITYRLTAAMLASVVILSLYQNCGNVDYKRIASEKISPKNCTDELQYDINATQNGEVKVPYTFSIYSTVSDCISNIATVEWDMGDDSLLSGISVEHDYLQEGVYQITAQVTTTSGSTQDLSHQINIVDPNGCDDFNDVQITGNPSRALVNSPLSFGFTALACLNINSISWSNDDVDNADVSTTEIYDTLFSTIGPKVITLVIDSTQGQITRTHNIDIVEECIDPYEIVPAGEFQCVGCSNGATNPMACDLCPAGKTLVNGQCEINCNNGANNPPSCNTCPAGKTLVNNQCESNCINGANNPPSCNTCPAGKTLVNNQCESNCINGANNPPLCNICPAGKTFVNNKCEINCNNGTNNPPSCNTCPAGKTLVNNKCESNCTNGANNPPLCNQCPAGRTLVNNQCESSCINGANNPPTCNECPAGEELNGGQCRPALTFITSKTLNGARRTSFILNSNNMYQRILNATENSPACTSLIASPYGSPNVSPNGCNNPAVWKKLKDITEYNNWPSDYVWADVNQDGVMQINEKFRKAWSRETSSLWRLKLNTDLDNQSGTWWTIEPGTYKTSIRYDQSSPIKEYTYTVSCASGTVWNTVTKKCAALQIQMSNSNGPTTNFIMQDDNLYTKITNASYTLAEGCAVVADAPTCTNPWVKFKDNKDWKRNKTDGSWELNNYNDLDNQGVYVPGTYTIFARYSSSFPAKRVKYTISCKSGTTWNTVTKKCAAP